MQLSHLAIQSAAMFIDCTDATNFTFGTYQDGLANQTRCSGNCTVVKACDLRILNPWASANQMIMTHLACHTDLYSTYMNTTFPWNSVRYKDAQTSMYRVARPSPPALSPARDALASHTTLTHTNHHMHTVHLPRVQSTCPPSGPLHMHQHK